MRFNDPVKGLGPLTDISPPTPSPSMSKGFETYEVRDVRDVFYGDPHLTQDQTRLDQTERSTACVVGEIDGEILESMERDTLPR